MQFDDIYIHIYIFKTGSDVTFEQVIRFSFFRWKGFAFPAMSILLPSDNLKIVCLNICLIYKHTKINERHEF